MIKVLKNLGLLISNFIICIGAGHGFGPVILIELFSLNTILFEGEIAFNGGHLPPFSFYNSYEDMLIYFLLLSFLGQFIFIISQFNFINSKFQKYFKFLGILLMVFGFFLITKNLFNDELALFSFVTGVPFLYFVFLEVVSLLKFKILK